MEKVFIDFCEDNMDFSKQLKITGFGVVMIAFFVIAFYFAWFGFNGYLSPDVSNWGAFGDYFGGILNPLIAGVALYWVMVSVKIQLHELKMANLALQDSIKMQADMAKLQKNSSEINAYNSYISAINADLSAFYEVRSRIESRLRDVDVEFAIDDVIELKKKLSCVDRDLEALMMERRHFREMLMETAGHMPKKIRN